MIAIRKADAWLTLARFRRNIRYVYHSLTLEGKMRYGRQSGPPSWFVILIGIAIVFGAYYLWFGLRNFMSTGVTVVESTQKAIERHTATAVRIQEIAVNAPTPLPSFTPIPPCQDFAVGVPEAIVREAPDLGSRIVSALKQGQNVCVIAALPNTEWYLIDDNPLTRRIDRVYMHRDIVYALNPTPKPTATFTPSATDTASPTFTRRARPSEASGNATQQRPTPSATPTHSPSPTRPSINL